MTHTDSTDDAFRPSESPTPEAPAPRRRGRPRKVVSEQDATAAKSPRPHRTVSPSRRPARIERESLVDTETATLDSYQRDEPLPVDDDAAAPSGAPIAEEPTIDTPAEETPALPTTPVAEEWSPSVQAPDGEIYLAASSTALDAPEGEEWQPSAAPRSGDPAPKPVNPAPADETWTPPASNDPRAAAANLPSDMPIPDVKPSDALKAALAGQRLSRFEMRKLSRRERAYLRAVQHGATIDFATFVARGNAYQNAAAKGLPPRQPGNGPASPAQPAAPRAPAPPPPPPLNVTELQALDVKTLLERAEELHIADDLPSLQKHAVIFELLRNYARRGGTIIAEGVLEIARDGNGFLRNRDANYHTCPEDAMVPVQMIHRLALRPGDVIVGPCKAPENSGKNKNFVLTAVDTVNGLTPALARRVTPFENQTPLFPNRRIVLETTPDNVEMRIVDLFTPVGFGQRGLIVAPPRTGKTVIMQKMANAITANYPDAYLIILLIDERPEEVTDMQRTTKAHVISSTFDEPPEHHVQVADLVIEMARRKVEMGEDVIILLDSITRLARAYNTLAPTNGRILSGGVEANALQRPKRFFGSARNLENGGSLTIIATALVETGSRMDEVIFEEFKGTGNMELCLDRSLVDKRVFPAINIARSGTRKEDLLVTDPLELTRSWFLRRAFSEADSIAATAMEELKSRLKKYPTNHDFLMGLQN